MNSTRWVRPILWVRCISQSSNYNARASKVGVTTRKRNPNTVTRAEKIDRVNMRSQSKLYHINQEFNIFTPKVSKILDLGYCPGNWLEFAKLKMCEAYDVEEEKINEKCNFLGFDLLVGTPPSKTSVIQGNIFSKQSHKRIIDHFKELAIRQKFVAENPVSEQSSYFAQEQTEGVLESKLENIEAGIKKLEIDETANLDYQVDLILSDLSTPFIQDKGFYHNTHTRPHMRFASNDALKEPVINREKSAIDMADALLLLACELLKKHGNLVIRLAAVDLDDPEVEIVSQRLQKVFNRVEERQLSTGTDMFFVCLDKKHSFAEKLQVFTKL